MERLRNTLLEYAWGSKTALADLLGNPSPSVQPQAEMWMGAHPSAPSVLCDDPDQATLAERIDAAPKVELGPRAYRRFQGRLPFLLKVLAAAEPLSLQAHPSQLQAEQGFAREEAAGLARNAPTRSYKDRNHKPEILCALGPFEALCGFRPRKESIELLTQLDAAVLQPVLSLLSERPGPEGIRAAFEHLMTMPAPARPDFLRQLLDACRLVRSDNGAFGKELACTLSLGERYPTDMGVAASLLLNHLHLEAGQAMYLPAGNLHTYLGGVGIELMANSDNVLRGGLTPKHVDVAELQAVLDFSEKRTEPVPIRQLGEHELEYVTNTPDFRLSVVELKSLAACRPERSGPEILLCVNGEVSATTKDGRTIELARGASAFVPASDGTYELRGESTVFRATVGQLD